MKFYRSFYLIFWLGILPLIVAGGAYYWTSPQVPVYQAKTVYTVVPRVATAPDNYQDLQATNLFIDVIKSWVYSDSLQVEISNRLSVAALSGWRSLSMQTFEVAVISSNQAEAIAGANTVREIIYREVGRYDKDQAGGYLIYNFDPVAKQIPPVAWTNAFLGWLVGVVLGAFLILIEKYYTKIKRA
ncbi:MAG: hypothetical protein V1807_02250 [Patescibacteria group bacterium]